MQRALCETLARRAKAGLGVAAPIGPRPSQSRARISVRVKPLAAPVTPKALRSVSISAASNACRGCGAKLTIRKRVYCDQCLSAQLAESRRATAANFAAAGPAKIAAMRAAGHNPTTTLEAQRRVATARAQRKAIASWRDDGCSMASISRVTFFRSCYGCPSV